MGGAGWVRKVTAAQESAEVGCVEMTAVAVTLWRGKDRSALELEPEGPVVPRLGWGFEGQVDDFVYAFSAVRWALR